MNNKVYVCLIALFLLAGCQAVNDDINKFQSGLQDGLNNLQGGMGIHSNIKEMHGIRFEAKSCELTEFRTIVCRLVVTSKYQDRTLNLIGTGYTKIQDDTGKTYPARISFGESAEGGQTQSILIADTPYNVTLTAENISSQATKVRAVDIGRMDAATQSGQLIGYIKLVLSRPPLPTTTMTAGQAIPSAGAKASSLQTSQPVARQSVKEFRGVRFETRSCELTELRGIICRLVVTSNFQDRKLNLIGTGYTKVQDDTGKAYPARISFGENAEGGQTQSVLIADTPYEITLAADNISSRATKVRAINIGRMDLASQSGQLIGYVKLVLAHPPMVATQYTESRPAVANTVPSGSQSIAPKVNAKAAAPVVATPATSKLRTSTPAAGGNRKTTARPDNISAKITFPGCWNWSNKAYIVVDAGGAAHNGPFGGTWKANTADGSRYTLTWPSFIDTLSLSADGNALSGANNYGLPVSATRKSGKVSGVEGTWLWSSGVTMAVHPDLSVSGGVYRGSWSKAGNKWTFEWPLVDDITLAADERSLSWKNQFGAGTAKRDASCKGK